MHFRLSERIVASYLLCKTKAHLMLAGEVGSKTEFESLLDETAGRVRDKFLNQFAADSYLNNAVLSRSVLKSGVPVITNAVFEEQDSNYVCDMLVRRKGESVLGDFHYVPAIIYGGYSNPPHARRVLSFTASKLADLQRFAPKQGLVYNAAYEQLPRTVALPIKPSEIKKIRMGIDAVRTDAPTLQLNSHCSICEFRSRCDSAARQGDSLSLLKGLGPKAISKLGRRGIFTVTQYSHTYRARRAHGGSTGAPRQHALQAMAVKEQKLYVIGKPELPASPTSVYIDFEGDPERGLVYLIGALVCEEGKSQQFSFWADHKDEESQILNELHNLLVPLNSFDVYCYGSYES
ncbi:MAG: TM0106 family RecB-like putative nuclease, partial [Pirellulaceae bacterium]|nr:TM0106 family RecB-like putative nuclease [Pirellulaceae bacterium]